MSFRLPARDWALIAGAAILLTLAYQPFHLVVPAFVCLVPAVLLILRGLSDERTWRRHLHQGFWYGVITHGTLLHWMAFALWQHGAASVALYVTAVVTFGAAYAVLFAVIGRIARDSRGRLVLALPAGIVLLEWMTAEMGPVSFPWHQLALTVATTPVLVQGADLAGAGGLAFVLAAINASFALVWWNQRSPSISLRHAETAGILLVLVVGYGLRRFNTLPLVAGADVAVVQPNVTADEKWVPDRENAIVERTVRLTERSMRDRRAALVVWPETAMPDAIQLRPAWGMQVTRLVHDAGTAILAGGVDLDVSPTGEGRRYNAAFALAPGGGHDLSSVYRKRQLVPTVERRVGVDLSRTSWGGFIPGRGVGIVDSPIGRYGVLLCYELTFAELAREARRNGAAVLVTLSNDAWFGHTSAPHQHFAHAVLRAVENRAPVVRAANTGVSGIVDPLGRVVTQTEPFVETYAVGQIFGSSVIPPAVYLAAYVGPLALGLLLTLLLAPRAVPNRIVREG